jgi:probable F420-dependent oxidoreductase
MKTSGSVDFKIGLQLPEAEREVPWSEMRAMARLAEEIGFDSLWVGDHLLYRPPGREPRGPWDAWTVMAALADATSTVEFGPLVACILFHNPAIIAKKAATIDEMSGGRFILGLGAGWNQAEFEAYGFPFDHRVGRFEEAFTIVRTLLSDGQIDFHGRYYDLSDCLLLPRGPRAEGPPLLIGSIGNRMLEITLSFVAAWNVWYADFDNSPDELKRVLERVDATCQNVGRDPATLSHTAAVLVGVTGSTGRESPYEESRRFGPIMGSADQIATELERFFDAGVDHLQIVLDPITIPAVEEIAPAIKLLKSR